MRLIDADALSDKLGELWGIPADWDGNMDETCEDAFTEIDNAPTVDAEPVKHGRWQWYEEWNPSTPDNPRECEDCGWSCSHCKRELEDVVGGYWDNPDESPDLPYCPNCGAKMKGGKVMTCKDCLHDGICEFYMGEFYENADKWCERFSDAKNTKTVIHCKDCIIKKAVPHKDGIVWRCPHRTGDVKMEGYCESGRKGC